MAMEDHLALGAYSCRCGSGTRNVAGSGWGYSVTRKDWSPSERELLSRQIAASSHGEDS